ncbi:hypothetical protein ACFSVJ_31315 [Prauserella oleivorans]
MDTITVDHERFLDALTADVEPWPDATMIDGLLGVARCDVASASGLPHRERRAVVPAGGFSRGSRC